MALFKCKICGGSLKITSDATVAECEYCCTKQTLPKLNDDSNSDRRANMYDRANHLWRNNEYDKAMGIYEQLLMEDKTDAEAYWSLILCRYGIEYVEDPATHRRLPTVNRAQFTSIFDDDNYRSALEYADALQKTIYESEAKAINEIQKGILAISQKEEPFDVFICYKETDAAGRRTPDSVLANDLYHQLTGEGFKVFFSRITLEDKLGSAYEPYIFAALNSARVMVVLGTRPEYFNAVWVKNEWSRYLSLIKQGQKKVLIPAYRDMDPYDLPEEFSHLQAQDMSKLGFMQDLIRGIHKLLQVDEPKPTVVKETVITAGEPATIAPLLKRIDLFLEDQNWEDASAYCEKVLDMEPECAEAYLGKLMVEMKVSRKEQLGEGTRSFADSPNYAKVKRFGDAALCEELTEYLRQIGKNQVYQRDEEVYKKAAQLEYKKTPTDLVMAAEVYESIPHHRDAAERARACRQEAAKLAFREAQRVADNAKNSWYYSKAAEMFHDPILAGNQEAAKQAEICKAKAEEAARAEKIAAQENKKKVCLIASISLVCMIGLIVFWILGNRDYGLRYAMKDGTYWVVGVDDNTKEEFVIPDTYRWKAVTGIDSSAFKDCTNLKSIIIPDSVTSIGGRAFVGCTGLKSIIIPDSVTSIGSAAFVGCTGLKSIIIPDSVTSIGESAFYNCSGLTSITIPDSVTSIGEEAFYNCSGLTSITIPDSVTSIGEWAFSNCTALTSIAIGNGATSIGEWAFYDCESLASIAIPDSVTSIGKAAFYNCSGLTSITIPDSVTSIGYSAFENCTSLTSITIPDSLTSIGSSAFKNCTSLTSITIPDSETWLAAFENCTSLTSVTIENGATSIGYAIFRGCKSLTSITIPDSVTWIGSSAFENCTSLTSITFKGTKSQWSAIKKRYDWMLHTGSFVVHCTDGDIQE